MQRSVIALSFVALLLVPTGFAGAPALMVTDAVGDVSRTYLDVDRVFVSSDPGWVYFHVKVRNIGTANPLDTGDTRYLYQVGFTSQYGRWFVDGVICYQNSAPPVAARSNLGVVNACYGTTATASQSTAATVTLMPALNTVVLAVKRTDMFPLQAGTTIADLSVKTGVSQGAVMPGAAGEAVLGAAFTTVDTADGTGSYLLD